MPKWVEHVKIVTSRPGCATLYDVVNLFYMEQRLWGDCVDGVLSTIYARAAILDSKLNPWNDNLYQFYINLTKSNVTNEVQGHDTRKPTILTILLYITEHWRSSYYAITHMRNKNSNIQGRSPNMVIVIFSIP